MASGYRYENRLDRQVCSGYHTKYALMEITRASAGNDAISPQNWRGEIEGTDHHFRGGGGCFFVIIVK